MAVDTPARNSQGVATGLELRDVRQGGEVMSYWSTLAVNRKYRNLSKRQKLAVKVGRRDGWTCHYCGLPLMPRENNTKFIEQYAISQERTCRGVQYVFDSNQACHGEIDHIIPQSVGGCDDLGNLVLACSACNLAKSDKGYQDFVDGIT